jgi:hypothetical protein
MNIKVLGAAVAAALLGLSTMTFGQGAAGGAAGSSAASGQDTPREAATGASGAGSAPSGAPSATTGSATGTVTSRCDTLTGAEKTRCQRDERASSGASTNPGVPVTPRPADSGPGALDKTRPGQEPASPGAANPRDVGTSSAGSN